jgi:hypothetical protein
MHKLLLVVVLLPNIASAEMHRCVDAHHRITYSDAPCVVNSVNETKSVSEKSSDLPISVQAKPDVSVKKESYTKDIPEMKAPDVAARSCFNFVNTNEVYPDPTSSKLLSSHKKWVSVKDVGARQMVTIEVTSKNTAGMYVGKQSYDCLLMGDGLTVNTKPAELL